MAVKIFIMILFGVGMMKIIPVNAATCSCAGVPLLSSMDTSSPETGGLNLNFTADFHEISDLVSGSDEINDETGRQRSSFSQVLSGTYGISNNWSLSALISRVEHKRKIGSSSRGQQKTSGIGDSVLLLRYSPVQITPFSRNDFSFGFGYRISTGKDDAGGVIALSEDMQPGTGANGKIVWGSYTHAFNQAATVNLNTSINYTVNAENKRQYSFGDELNVAVGLSYLNLQNKLGFGAALRYRQTQADERSGFKIPNTGGQWLDLVPSVQYTVNDKLGLAISGRIPLARELDGVLQFTTSYSYALSISYAL